MEKSSNNENRKKEDLTLLGKQKMKYPLDYEPHA